MYLFAFIFFVLLPLYLVAYRLEKFFFSKNRREVKMKRHTIKFISQK